MGSQLSETRPAFLQSATILTFAPKQPRTKIEAPSNPRDLRGELLIQKTRAPPRHPGITMCCWCLLGLRIGSEWSNLPQLGPTILKFGFQRKECLTNRVNPLTTIKISKSKFSQVKMKTDLTIFLICQSSSRLSFSIQVLASEIKVRF